MYRSVSSSSRYSASPPTSTLSTSQASQSGGGLSAGAVQTGGSGSNGGASGGGNFGSNSRSSLSGAGAHRLEQILQNFYLKTAQIITQSRQSGVNASSHSKDPLRQPSLDTLNSTSTGRPSGQPRKTNKWFNMELEDTDELRDELKLWKATAVLSVTPPPPMIIEVFVDCSDLAPSQIPVLMDGDQGRKAKIEGISTNSGGHLGFGSHRRSTILLESWQLTLDTQASSSLPELPTLYKRCIMFFRALFTYTRLLPSYRLCRRLRRSLGQSIPLHIGYRFTTVTSARPDEIQLEMPLTDLEPRPITNTHRFETVDTPAGLFTLQVTYRQYCELTVNDPEQLLSSSLVDMEENYFSPSLVQESRMRSLLQRDLKRDGELSMPSSPVNTSALHAQSWRTGSSLRPMPASFPNPAPSAFFSLGEGTPTSTISNGPEEDPNHAATLPLDGSPIFSPPLFSTTGHAPTESRMRSLLSQTSAYSTTDSLPPFSNPIDMHRLAHRSSRGSMKSVASRSSSRPPSIVSSSPRDTTHFIAGGHRASTSIGSAVIATTPSHINNNTTNVNTHTNINTITPPSVSNIYAGMVMDRSSSGRPPSFTSMSPHDIFPPRSSPASKGSPSLYAMHQAGHSYSNSGNMDAGTVPSPQTSGGILPSFTLPFAVAIPSQRLSGASISSQDVVPPRTLPVHSGSSNLARRTSNSQSVRRGRSNTRQSDESITSERRLSRGSVRSFTATASQKDVDDVASFVHMIDTHMSMQLSGGNGGEASSGPNASSRRQSSDRRLSIGIGHTSNTSLLLHDTDHALSRFQQLRDETNLLTESMQLGHALSSSQHPSQLVGASGLPPPSTSTISSISSMATTGRGRPTSRHSFTNLILPHRRTPSNGSINSERTPGPIIRHSRANTLEGDSDQPSSSLPFASSIPPASEPVSNEPLSTAPDSPSMACAPLLAIADRPFLADDLPVPLADEAMNDSPMNPNTHVRRMSLVTRVPNTGLSLEDASITNTDEQPDNSLLSQPSREFGGNSLEDDGMIFGLADLSFGERSAGSGGAVGPHRPPHW